MNEVPLLSGENYRTFGRTAFYDSIRFAIDLEMSLKQEFKQIKKTVFLTNASDNNSINTTESQLKTLIFQRRKKKD
jgi:hypothetical protein